MFVHGFLVDDTLWSDVPERLAEQGFHTFAPTWPLGAHPTAMKAGADLSPRGVARVVLSFLEALDLTDVVLVGSDTGGAVSQFLLDEDPIADRRAGAHQLRRVRHLPAVPVQLAVPARPAHGRRPAGPPGDAAGRPCGTAGSGSAGWSAATSRAEESRRWVTPYLTDAGVRRDVAAFARAWRPTNWPTSRPGWRDSTSRCCSAGRRPTRSSRSISRTARRDVPRRQLVEFRGALTFVSLDQPERLAEEIAASRLTPRLPPMPIER